MAEGDIRRLELDPFVQFGKSMSRKTYLGARFFPERPIYDAPNNVITEEEVVFRTIIAEDSGRYDPPARRSATDVKSMEASMGHFDALRDINGQVYDTLIKILDKQGSAAARLKLLGLVDKLLKHALLDKKEKQRWDMIIESMVHVAKANKQEYTVQVDAPAQNRFTSDGFFNDNTFNPFDPIFDAVQILKDHGFGIINAVVSTSKPISAMRNNEIVQRRTGGMQVDTVNNSVTPVTGVPTNARINAILSEQGIPPITEYDEGYNTEDGFTKYIPEDAIAVIAATDRDEEMILSDGDDLLLPEILTIPNTLGYYAVGTCQGRTEPGDVIKLFPKENKPVRIEGQAEGVGLPVPVETKAIVIIRGCVPVN